MSLVDTLPPSYYSASSSTASVDLLPPYTRTAVSTRAPSFDTADSNADVSSGLSASSSHYITSSNRIRLDLGPRSNGATGLPMYGRQGIVEGVMEVNNSDFKHVDKIQLTVSISHLKSILNPIGRLIFLNFFRNSFMVPLKRT